MDTDAVGSVERRLPVELLIGWDSGCNPIPAWICFVVNCHFGRLGYARYDESILDYGESSVVDVGSGVLHLLPLLKDLLPDSNVYCECDCDDDPHGPIEYCDTKEIPVDGNPAPHLKRVKRAGGCVGNSTYHGRAVNLAPDRRIDEEIGDGRDKRRAIAEESVLPLQGLQSARVILVKEGEVDVAGH